MEEGNKQDHVQHTIVVQYTVIVILQRIKRTFQIQ